MIILGIILQEVTIAQDKMMVLIFINSLNNELALLQLKMMAFYYFYTEFIFVTNILRYTLPACSI
jgi:hypothetical protein